MNKHQINHTVYFFETPYFSVHVKLSYHIVSTG